VIVGYVGEDGIEAGKWYKLVDGKIVESPDDDPDYSWIGFSADKLAETCAKDAREMQLELGIKS
jgi:hypothetical protein